MAKAIKENKIQQLTDIEHVILRPGQYVGSTNKTKCFTFLLNRKTEMFEYKEFEYVPALLKIIYEILDNAVDESIRTNFKFGKNISIDIKDGKVKVSDNGRGIPLGLAADGKTSQLELALTELRAGSNFNDDEGRNLLGMNGVGSSLTNIFSLNFKATVFDGKRKGVLTCKNNLSSKKCVISEFPSKETGTTIEFSPDLAKFNLTKIDEVHENLIFQRLMFLSYMYPEITFKFNGKIVRFKTSKNLMSLFNEKFVAITDDNKPNKFLIGIIPNNNDDFTHKSYINGADCIHGGNHIDYIHSELIGKIKERLNKKYSSIKPGDIKNKLSYVVIFREFINPMFNSQTKENFSSDVNEIKEFLGEVDWDNLAQKVTKCAEIMDPILESFKIKEELKNRQTLSKLGKTTKAFKCDKFLPATKSNNFFCIVEGNSASGGLSNCFGRSEFGYFSTRGVPLNAYEATVAKLADNEELSNMIKLLNLSLKEETQDLTYENIVIATDQDLDGVKIAGLYLGFFSKYCPSIITAGKLKRLRTPVIVFKDKKEKIKHFFFTLNEYNEFIKTHDVSNLKIHYYKGLGSWEPVDLKPLIEQYGIDFFMETFVLDEAGKETIDNWLNSKNADKRKEYLKQNEFSIFNI
jgi:DNA topoisomerase-2